MRLKMWWLWFVASFLCAANSTPAWAQRMKLLAPGVGWTNIHGGLLWTNDDGHNWKNITPPHPNDAVMRGIFFLDTTHGWVAFVRGDSGVTGGVQFDLATTENSGANWSYGPVQLPASRAAFNGGAGATFADPTHGWLDLSTNLSTAFNGAGVRLATSDGGRSWHWAAGPLGSITMITPEFGWMVAGHPDDGLYVTRDGAQSWQRVQLQSPVITDQMRKADENLKQFTQSWKQHLPPEKGPLADAWMAQQSHTYATYDLPVFKDAKTGFVAVTYPGVVILFATTDGGVTWKPDRVVTGLHEHSMDTKVVSALADSTWIISRVAKDSQPQLKALGPGANVNDNTMPAPEESGISQMSFASANEGWVLTVYGKLFATSDGGATWTDITPSRAPRSSSP